MIRVGVIGVGSMGQNHARVYFNHDRAELVAVADPNPEFLKKVCRTYNTKGYSDYREMIEKEGLDAVSVVVPTKFHKEVTIFALSKGKHVLLEKPIASTEEEAREIIDCADKNKVTLMVGHIERFNPAILELKKRLPELGEIYKIDVQRIGPFPARITDVGVVIDLSVHDIDVINYLINHHPTRIYAEIQRKLHPHHEDFVSALLRYENDFGNEIAVTMTVDYLSPTKVRQIQVFGKKGMFKVNYLDQELYFYENSGYSSESWDTVIEGDMKKIHFTKKEPLAIEIDAFISCISENSPSPVSGEHGLQVLKIAHKILASAKENKIISYGESHETSI